jgi:small GTP-binding protein
MQISNPNKYDIIIKCLLLGDKCVGKSSFLQKYTNNIFDNNYVPTIGYETQNFYYSYNEKIIKMQIWDIAGHEKYRSSINLYYKNTNGIILFFDLSEEDTFINIRNWIKEINKYKYTNTPIILVGNKADKQIINNKICEELAEEFECLYYKISVKNRENIDKILISMIELTQYKK